MSKELDKSNSNEISINSREKILKLEKDVLALADGVNIIGDGKEIIHSNIVRLKHTFADGIYVRQMSVATEDTTEDYIAPCYVVATPGVKRVIYANEDSIFVNIHKNPSNTQDIDVLEKEIVALNYKEYEEYINQNK